MWKAVLQRVEDRPAMAWLQSLALLKLDDNRAVLAPASGTRQIASFANDPGRQEQVATQLSDLLGRRIRVTIEQKPVVDPNADQVIGGSGPTGTNGASRVDLQSVRELPLVNQVFRTFPQATLMDARRDETQDKA